MADALAAYDAIRPEGPVHIHIAEQEREVAECLAWSGRRPVEWLLDGAQVDRRWTLVHATHMTADENKRAAATGAIAGLCPTTEANLGDGVFALPEWLDGREAPSASAATAMYRSIRGRSCAGWNMPSGWS